MSDARKVPADTAWRIARNSLGRLACAYADPADESHDHALCLLDDESLIADRMLRLLAAAVAGDEDKVLDRLTELSDSIDRK